jgi:hypothetical protein
MIQQGGRRPLESLLCLQPEVAMQGFDQILDTIFSYLPNLLAALGILVLGALIAFLLAALVRAALRRTSVDNKVAEWLAGEERGKPIEVEAVVGRVVFWLLMIFVLVAFVEALNLTVLTQPLTGLLNELLVFLPRLLGAAALLAIAWIVATVLRTVVTRLLNRLRIDERLKEEGLDGGPKLTLARTLGDVVYWMVFLLFFPAVLSTLALEGLLQPVQGMVNEILAYLPNLATAAVIILVGWFVARVLQRIVTNLLAAVGADQLGVQVGADRALGKYSLSKMLGLIVYILVLIPVIIAALNALAIDAITQPASNMLDTALSALPSIVAALLLLTVAYFVARVIAGFVTALLSGMGFDRLIARLGLGQPPTEGEYTPSGIAGYILLVVIMLFAAIEALALLGFETLSTLVAEFTVFGGDILLGAVVFGLGMFLANIAAKAIQSSGAKQAPTLALAARIAILVLAGAMALQQAGVADEIIILAFGLSLGAVAIAVAIAFGLGGRDLAARQLEEWRSGGKDV